MSGGDLRIFKEGITGLGMASQLDTIDAHSVRAGDFTEERKLNQGTVFLTREGAAAYDSLRSEGFTFVPAQDPTGLKKLLLGDCAGPKGEQFKGDPTAVAQEER